MIPTSLPAFKCPAIFEISGGTRVFCVMGGPGQRTEVERTQGKHGHTLSTNTIVDQPSCVLAKEVVTKVVKALEEITRVIPYFDGAAIDYIPDVWHDGAPKSVMSHEIFEQVAQFRHVNKMKDSTKHASIDVFWEEALNRTDVTLVKTVIVFCSNESLGRILRGTNLLLPNARTCAASGVIIPINIPINAQASLCLGCGPFAHHDLQWGTTTKEEYQAMQPSKQEHQAMQPSKDGAYKSGEAASPTRLCAQDDRHMRLAARFVSAMVVIGDWSTNPDVVQEADDLGKQLDDLDHTNASLPEVQKLLEQGSRLIKQFVASKDYDSKNSHHLSALDADLYVGSK
jgi:hypothetical protein